MATQKKILLVDDEKDIVEFIKYNLEKENYKVITAYDGEEALEKIVQNPDLVILDILMPKLTGYEVCKKIKGNMDYHNIPIIFLTAKTSEIDEILGLELGASDYIKKPISPQQLMARVKSNLRKFENKDELSKKTNKEIYNINGLIIDIEKYIVKVHNIEKLLPKKEFELLCFLVKNQGKVFSRELLLQNVWGANAYVDDRTVDVHIRKIREKLGDLADLIETKKGVGYKFKDV
ncbi:MAG: response regulator transcription factor [Ignavibacteriaceae bacterium]|nr:response regulator transcription factor [Ignavibacteriaceae bacterium]